MSRAERRSRLGTSEDTGEPQVMNWPDSKAQVPGWGNWCQAQFDLAGCHPRPGKNWRTRCCSRQLPVSVLGDGCVLLLRQSVLLRRSWPRTVWDESQHLGILIHQEGVLCSVRCWSMRLSLQHLLTLSLQDGKISSPKEGSWLPQRPQSRFTQDTDQIAGRSCHDSLESFPAMIFELLPFVTSREIKRM